MIHTWSKAIARYSAREIKLNGRKEAIVSYGLKVILGGIIKLIVFLLVPLSLGVFSQFTAACLSSGFLRLPSGGAHCSAYYRCLITSLSVFLLIAVVAKYLSLFITPDEIFLWFSLALAFIVFIRLAPVDVPQKPIRSKVHRKALKIASCALVLVYFAIFLYWKPGSDVVLSTSLAILFHTFTLTRSGHNFLAWVDNVI